MFDVAGVVIGSTFLVATAACIWKLWSSYLNHRETMKRLEVVAALVVLVAGLACPPGWAGISDRLRERAEAAPAGVVPVLRVLDEAGELRWQLPVGLWGSPKPEFGGYHYPGAVSTDGTLSIEGPLVFVGYGLTREDWDDYRGEQIEGAVAIVFMGTPVLDPEVERRNSFEVEDWQTLVREKVDNAKIHGAVAVLLEQNPLAPPYGEDIPEFMAAVLNGLPASASLHAEQLALPTLSMGSKLLEVVVSQSSDLFGSRATCLDRSLTYLIEDAEERAAGLGPIPLGLRGEVQWDGGRLERRAAGRCDLWYQPGSPAERDLELLAAAVADTLESLESLLSTRVEDRITVLLFADWRSKMVCTGSVGWGSASGTHTAMVYEGGGLESSATFAHEVCHLVAGTVGSPPACFSEGLGRLVGDTLGDLAQVDSGSLAADVMTAAFLEEGKLWSLPELLKLTDIGSRESRSPVAYPEAASFCAYLIRKVGFDGFRTLYATLGRDDFEGDVTLIEKACGATLTEIEEDWHRRLSADTPG